MAAALALNIQNIVAEALIDEDISVTAKGGEADGIVAVQSYAYNESIIMANGSASKGKIGVGVAVAINVVDYENTAVIGDSEISADTLIVEAGMIRIRIVPGRTRAGQRQRAGGVDRPEHVVAHLVVADPGDRAAVVLHHIFGPA